MGKIIRTERYKRGFIGLLTKWLFIGFNALMVVWLISYWGQVGEMQPASEAGRAGAAIGGMLGTGTILFFWVAGVVILGLAAILTRGRKVIVEELVE